MPKPFDFDERLREIDRFFQERDAVHQTMACVVGYLEQAGIAYAIIGGMAVFAHGHQQTTGDVDVLLTLAGFVEFQRRFVPGDFEKVPGKPRRFRDPVTDVLVDAFVAGMFAGSGEPGPIAFPDPAVVSVSIKQKQVVNLSTLIELKLAARLHKHLGDAVALIRTHNLDESFRENLHPSVHRAFLECLTARHYEDECEALQDRAFEERTRPAPPPS